MEYEANVWENKIKVNFSCMSWKSEGIKWVDFEQSGIMLEWCNFGMEHV